MYIKYCHAVFCLHTYSISTPEKQNALVTVLSPARMSAASTPIARVRTGWSSSSLKNKGLSPAACSTPLLTAFPGNDDEQERRQRRRSRVIDLQAATDTSFSDSASHRWTTLAEWVILSTMCLCSKMIYFLFAVPWRLPLLCRSCQMPKSQSTTPLV